MSAAGAGGRSRGTTAAGAAGSAGAGRTAGPGDARGAGDVPAWTRGASPQAVDPLGASGARPVTLAAGVAALLLGVVATLTGPPQTDPAAALIALAAVAAAGLVLYLASSPLRAPFRTSALVLVVALAAVAHGASAAATWGANPVVRDDWVPVAAGVLVLGTSPYRRCRDVLLAGGAAASVVAAVTVVQAPQFSTPVPVAVFVVVAVTPVVALSVAGAVFSAAFVGEVRAWRERAGGYRAGDLGTAAEALVRSVQQDRVTALNRDVVPFFSDLLARGVVTADDVARAATVADEVRRRLVAEADRSWLEAYLAAPERPASGAVEDPGHLADRMPHEGRTVLRALLGVLGEGRLVDPHRVRVVLAGEGRRSTVTVTSPARVPAALLRQRLSPWVAVLRVVADDVRLDPSDAHLTLRFSYDQH